jgi:CubicO group peptidase (beta-lactamase class C family)
LKIARLILVRGLWQGKPLVAQRFLGEATRRPSIPNLNPSAGLGFFLQPAPTGGDPIMVQHSGDGGNWLLIYPRENAVAVRLREVSNKPDAFDKPYAAIYKFLSEQSR